MTQRLGLKDVATATLERLREAIATGHLRPPVDRTALIGLGLHHQIDAVENVLGGHQSAACLAILDVTLAERQDRRPSPELVWTGPEGSGGLARDTAVVLRSLFESARESVVLAGYTFDHATDVLAPLHAAMTRHPIQASFFVNLEQIERGKAPDAHLGHHLGGFLRGNWPFGPPCPRLYFDRRALEPGPPWCSLHAKCVVVDATRAFVSSANFTQRGQERNIEVGVLVDDPSFASHLAGQWLGLIAARLAIEYPPASGLCGCV